MPENKLDIELFISTHCPHCAQTLELLTTAIKHEEFSSLKIINLNTLNNPTDYSYIRSVPFIKIDGFEFSGEITKSELDNWLSAYKNGTLSKLYFTNLLMDGLINQLEHFIKRKPGYWLDLINLAQDPETKMQVRIGITALFESLNKEVITIPSIDKIITSLIHAAQTTEDAIQVDLIYLLSLLYSALKEAGEPHKALNDFIESRFNDKSDEIKEIIEDVFH